MKIKKWTREYRKKYQRKYNEQYYKKHQEELKRYYRASAKKKEFYSIYGKFPTERELDQFKRSPILR